MMGAGFSARDFSLKPPPFEKRILMTLDIAVHKNWGSHIDASHSRQPLVKGERLVRYEVNAVIWKANATLDSPFGTQQHISPATPEAGQRPPPRPHQPPLPPLAAATESAPSFSTPRLQRLATQTRPHYQPQSGVLPCRHMNIKFQVTQVGVLPIAVCHASATREEPSKPKRPPRTKIM